MIASRLDGSPRLNAIGTSDAHATMLTPLAGNAAPPNVGTRALLAEVHVGRTWSYSRVPPSSRKSDR